MRASFFLPLVLCAASATRTLGEVRIDGSNTLAALMVEAGKILRDEQGIKVTVGRDGTSSVGIQALGNRRADIAMLSRPISNEDRTEFPEKVLTEIAIGQHVIAVGVSKDVWEGGLRALSKAQLQQLYGSKVSDWSALGGPKRAISFFNFEEGFGTWEAFAQWVYGDNKRAPAVKFATVDSNENARGAIEAGIGAAALLSPLTVDGVRTFALAIKTDDQTEVAPTAANVAAKKYPIVRPLLLVIDDKPILEVKQFTNFMLSPRGGELMRKHGFFDVETLKAAAK